MTRHPSIDPYAVLGLDRSATETQIRQARRRLVWQCHPDANAKDPSADRRFREIQAAYEILLNPV